MPGNIDLTFRVAGVDAVASSLQQIENRARGMASSMVSSTGNARSAIRALDSAIAAAGTVARIAGVAQGEFASKLTDVTLAVSSAAFAVQALRGITLSWATVTAAATAAAAQFSAALAILSGPVGLVILGVAALTTGVILLIRHFQSLNAATDDAAKSAATMATAARGLHDANLILAGSLAQVSLAFTDYGIHLNAAGAGLEGFARQLRGMEFQDTLTSLDQLIARKEALGGTIVNTSARLGFLISVQWEYLQTLQLIAQRTGLTRDQQQALTAKIEAAKNSLIGLNGELGKEARGLQDSAAALSREAEAADEAERALAKYEKRLAAIAAWVIPPPAVAVWTSTPELRAFQEALTSTGDVFNSDFLKPLESAGPLAEDVRRIVQSLAETLDVDFAEALDLVTIAQDRAAKAGISLKTALAQVTKEAKQAADTLAGWKPDVNLRAFQDLITAGVEVTTVWDVVSQRFREIPEALKPVQTAMQQLVQQIQDVFEQGFGDILFRARDFSDVLQSILEMIGRSLIRNLFQNFDLFKFLGFQQSGMISILGAQGGALISRPTLAMIGEGGQSEAVVPLPDNRTIPVRFTGEGRQAQMRPQEIVVKVINVFDRSQIPATQPDEIVAVIANDMMRGGPTEHVVRKIIGGR